MRTPVRKYWRSEERTNKQKKKQACDGSIRCWLLTPKNRWAKTFEKATANGDGKNGNGPLKGDTISVRRLVRLFNIPFGVDNCAGAGAVARVRIIFFFCLLCLFLLSLAIQWSCECAATTTTKSASGEILYLIGFMGLSAGLFNIRVQKF